MFSQVSWVPFRVWMVIMEPKVTYLHLMKEGSTWSEEITVVQDDENYLKLNFGTSHVIDVQCLAFCVFGDLVDVPSVEISGMQFSHLIQMNA